jgi:malic enzyme
LTGQQSNGPVHHKLITAWQVVAAVMNRWPEAILQFEDFSINHALELLNRYRK